MMEVSPFNPGARRLPGGVWNEHQLPVLEWEISEQQALIPHSLQVAMDLHTPVLRWDRRKYESVVNQHRRDISIILELSRYLDAWVYVGEETGSYEGNRRILFQDRADRWYSASVGPIQNSYNMITVFGSSKPNFLENRLRLLRNFKERRVTLGQGG